MINAYCLGYKNVLAAPTVELILNDEFLFSLIFTNFLDIQLFLLSNQYSTIKCFE